MNQNTTIKAVIFDVDGTLADTERHGHLIAFNRAFEKAGLPDRWDEEQYGELLAVAGGRERIYHYFTEDRSDPPPKDPEELAKELHEAKVEELEALIREGELEPRPGVARLMDELDREEITRAVATTGTRSTILDLLASLKLERAGGFAAVLTADEAPTKKPDPQVYEMALEELGVSPYEAVAIEDSRNGLLSAKAAGIPCLITVSDYNVEQAFDEADLVVSDLGEPDAPAKVLSDPHGIAPAKEVVIDPQLLRSLTFSASRTV